MDRPTTGPSPTGSRIRVSCGHCNSVMERRNLKSHTTRVHVGLPVVEKVSREQRTITFPVHTIKRSIEPWLIDYFCQIDLNHMDSLDAFVLNRIVFRQFRHFCPRDY